MASVFPLKIRPGSIALLISLSVAGCGANTTPLPTAALVPPTSVVLATPTVPDTRVWNKVAFGASNVTITFYSDTTGTPCIRYQTDTRVQTPVEKCATATNLVAEQGTVTDALGKMYTVIVGRILSPQITAVSLEMSTGENSPAEITDNGFAVILSGQHKAIRAVPIDQYGNLVGQIFSFG